MIRDLIEQCEIDLKFINTKEQMINAFTKSLSKEVQVFTKIIKITN